MGMAAWSWVNPRKERLGMRGLKNPPPALRAGLELKRGWISVIEEEGVLVGQWWDLEAVEVGEGEVVLRLMCWVNLWKLKFMLQNSLLSSYNQVALSTFTTACNHHLYLVPKHHYHPQNEPHILSSCSLFLSLQLLATTYLHSLPMDLPIMNISYKWNHTIRELLCLTSFT